METVTIQVTDHALNPEISILHIQGIIHATTLPQVNEAFQTVLKSRKKKIIFDLTGTTYISSGGWGLFIACHQAALEKDAVIAMTGMKLEVFDAFELLEYDKVLAFFTTTEDALKQGFGKVSGLVNSPNIALA